MVYRKATVRLKNEIPLSTRAMTRICFYFLFFVFLVTGQSAVVSNVMLTGVPDYTWHAGCFGTGSGNLMGYWDRHGFPNFYTGPTAGGEAPLDSNGGNEGIRSMWASKAGFDGRPANQPGHIDDYWISSPASYESTDPDPYVTAGRPEHNPDCIGDFIGLSQKKWTNLNNECDGNIDAFSFVFWETNGARRANYVPPPQGNSPVPDIPSGLREWTKYRGYAGNVYSQLADFNLPAGAGFTFDDLKAEIDAGYPVLIFMQPHNKFSRSMAKTNLMLRANPLLHGILAYGYVITDTETKFVRYKNSHGSSGDNSLSAWTAAIWYAALPVRGVIGYHPLPQITSITRTNETIHFKWHGPSSTLSNLVSHTSTAVHRYVIEKSTSLGPASFVPVSPPTTTLETTLTNCCDNTAFFRVSLLPP